MDPPHEAAELADDLQLLREESISEGEFRAKYSARKDVTVVTTVWPYLEHFLSHADIRARDEEYRTMQKTELTKLVSLLRAGAPDAELRRIHFLGYSDR